MNKKIEGYLWPKSIVARKLIDDKEFYEEKIKDFSSKEKVNDFARGVDAGVVVGFKFAARDIKTTLQLLLEEVQNENNSRGG